MANLGFFVPETYNYIVSGTALEGNANYLEDFVVAQNAACKITPSADKTIGREIIASVSEELGPEANQIELIAVSALAAEIRIRNLRRPLNSSENQSRQLDRDVLPPFSLKRIKQKRYRFNQQTQIVREQIACSKFIDSMIDLAEDLKSR